MNKNILRYYYIKTSNNILRLGTDSYNPNIPEEEIYIDPDEENYNTSVEQIILLYREYKNIINKLNMHRKNYHNKKINNENINNSMRKEIVSLNSRRTRFKLEINKNITYIEMYCNKFEKLNYTENNYCNYSLIYDDNKSRWNFTKK